MHDKLHGCRIQGFSMSADLCECRCSMKCEHTTHVQIICIHCPRLLYANYYSIPHTIIIKIRGGHITWFNNWKRFTLKIQFPYASFLTNLLKNSHFLTSAISTFNHSKQMALLLDTLNFFFLLFIFPSISYFSRKLFSEIYKLIFSIILNNFLYLLISIPIINELLIISIRMLR